MKDLLKKRLEGLEKNLAAMAVYFKNAHGINSRLTQALTDVKTGHIFGPFKKASEAIRFLHHNKPRRTVTVN